MKRIIRTGVLLAAMLMGVSTFAMKSGPFVKVSTAGNKEFTLFINEVNAPAVVVSLRDLSGNMIYEEVLLSQNSYSKLYDLTALAVGSYLLEVEENTRINTWSVELSAEGLSVNLEEKKEVYKPRFVTKRDVLGISYFNKSEEPVQLTILNTLNEVMFSDELPADLVITKQYDLSGLARGKYYVVASTTNRSFEEAIEIH